MIYNRSIETCIIFGAYNRKSAAIESIKSLQSATHGHRVRIIVSDASDNSDLINNISMEKTDYIWTPGEVSMATSRNLAMKLACDKYVFQWVLFVEDDIIYHDTWYDELLAFAKTTYGKKSPLGLAYGVFSASPHQPEVGDSCYYDEINDCWAEMYGPRADQRLYNTAHYISVAREWDSDVLGISSSQTGKMNHRNTMRGYCAAYIGHRNLCSAASGDTSTWEGLRDIGPAAFDKRVTGHKIILDFASNNFSNFNRESDFDSAPRQDVPMTNIIEKERFSLFIIWTRIKRAVRLVLSGR